MERREFRRNLDPGAPIIAPAPGGHARIVRPDGGTETVEAAPATDGAFIRYDRTDVPGDYDVRTDVAADVPGLAYHVRPDPAASDLRTLDAEGQAAFEQTGGLLLCDREPALVEQVGRHYTGRPWSPYLAAALALGLLAEMGLSRRFFA